MSALTSRIRLRPRSSEPASANAGYARGAQILGLGIGLTGMLTALYFVVASHVLGPVEAKRVDVLWSITWVVISVIYRPIEQLLSRSIAERLAHGHEEHPLRAPLALQGAFASVFLALALAARPWLQSHVFDHSRGLFWVLVGGVLFYAASYFARGWLAGHRRFGLYGTLVFCEAFARLIFALAVAIGIAHGQVAVALGIAVAPLVSLVVVPAAVARHRAREKPTTDNEVSVMAGPASSARRSAGFALGVAGIMISEQTLLNAGVLTVDATAANAALAGIVFNILLIVRAPLQLFQAIQTSLLPHLTTLAANGDEEGFAGAIRGTVLIIAGLGVAVVVGLSAIGPFVMRHAFGQHFTYQRIGLAAMGLGMALHLTAGALNQAALARQRERAAAASWAFCAGLFLIWTLLPVMSSGLDRVEAGYPLATGLLCVILWQLERRPDTRTVTVADVAAAEAEAQAARAEPEGQRA